MKITEDELKRRLESSKNLVNSLHIVKSIPTVPGNGTPHAPKSLRIVAGVLAHIEPTKKVSEELNLTPAQVRQAKSLPDVKPAVERVQDLALDMLIDSLGLLTTQALIGERPKDIASIAANMSRVYSNVRPQNVEGNRTQILIYSPRQRSVTDFDVVEVLAG